MIIKSWKSIVYFILPLIVLTVSLTPNGGKAQSFTLKDRPFLKLEWGISFSRFVRVYPRGHEVRKVRSGYIQDLFEHYDHPALIGFDFGENNKMRRIIASFLFYVDQKPVTRNDVLTKSKRILDSLEKTYGKPTVNSPWDGSTFTYIWVRPAELIQFAWDGRDGWGLQYRSRRFDPEFSEIMQWLESQGIKVQ